MAQQPTTNPHRPHGTPRERTTTMTQHHTDEDLLTITEAADVLRTPVATLRYWRYLHTGPQSFRLGRRVLYRADDLHAWIQAQHDGPAA